jgi:hypothetical protein
MSALAAVALVAVFANGAAYARPITKGAAITSAALMGNQPKSPRGLATKRRPGTQPNADIQHQTQDAIIRNMRQ